MSQNHFCIRTHSKRAFVAFGSTTWMPCSSLFIFYYNIILANRFFFWTKLDLLSHYVEFGRSVQSAFACKQYPVLWEFLFQLSCAYVYSSEGGTCDDRHRRKMAQFVKKRELHTHICDLCSIASPFRFLETDNTYIVTFAITKNRGRG